MARDYEVIGSTPHGEDCAQVGSQDYFARAMKECRAFQDQIRRLNPEIPMEMIWIKSFPHDFGTYHEVCFVFDHGIEQHWEWMSKIEDNIPEYWDEIAKSQLK